MHPPRPRVWASLRWITGLALMGTTVPGLAAPEATSAAPGGVPFTIGEFRVLGNSVLPTRAIESAVYPFLGPERRLKDVEGARDALAETYRKAGFGTVFIDIPEQDVTDGIVRLKVTEGRVGRLVVKGERFTSGRQVRDAVSSVHPGSVPSLPVLQQQLATLAQQNPERQITPVLRPGQSPGTLDVELDVKDSLPVHGSIELDNDYTADTKPLRLNVALSYTNLFQQGATLSGQYQTTPQAPSEVKAGVVSFVGRVGDTADAWSLSYVHSDSNVAALGTLAVIGAGDVYGARYIVGLPVVGHYTQNFTFGYDYKSFGQNVETTTLPSAQTPISYSLLSGSYASSLHTEHLAADISFGAKLAWRGFGDSSTQFEFKRFDAKPDFFALVGSDDLTWFPWRDAAVTGRLSYQYSPQPLVNNEQFAIGGISTVRGYFEAESLWDTGGAASVELASPTLVLRPLASAKLGGFLFFDAGAGLIESPLPGELPRVTLMSTGAGLRFARSDNLVMYFDWAYPLRNGPDTLRGADRWLFSIKAGF